MREIIIFSDAGVSSHDSDFTILYAMYKNYYKYNHLSYEIIIKKCREEVLKEKMKISDIGFRSYLCEHVLDMHNDISIEERLNPYLIEKFKSFGNKISYIKEGVFFKIKLEEDGLEAIVYPDEEGFIKI